MPKQKYQTPHIMHDAPIRDDSKNADFHFEDFAATLARLAASKDTKTPLAIGINGAWGSGKTSLLWLIQDMLANPKKGGEHRFAPADEGDFRVCRTIWFDAWKYNDEDKLLVALVRVILQAMQNGSLKEKFTAWLENPLAPQLDMLGMFVNAFELKFGGLGAELKFNPDLKGHEKTSPFETHTAFFDYFNDAFDKLLEVWLEKDGVMVIFIDDLDRCLPAKTVQTLEAIKLFLDKNGCVFMLGADTKIVQMAVETHYKNAGITGESAKDYLEKIIQLRFDLPPIVEDAMQKFLQAQDKDTVPDEMLTRWKALVAAAEVNPRRVKNVINDLNLQWYMAVNSGQTKGVNRDDFICWQALMRSAPAKFATQIMDFEDRQVRHNFLMDALKWQKGTQEEKESVKGFFNAYEDRDSKRMRGVLKQISFSKGFDADALDAMIYLSAPPAKLEPVSQIASLMPAESATQTEFIPEPAAESIFEKSAVVMRGEAKPARERDSNRIAIGGIEFVKIPKGSFLMGSKNDNELAYDSEKPQHSVDIPYDYWLARFIMTNELYAQYLDKKKHPVSDWQKKKDHPVVNVSWDDAMAYCKWFNQTFKSELGDLLLRLPTEAEWEKAARGAYANEWPWGNEFDPKKCNSFEGGKGGTTPVGMYSSPGGDSPYGCADMVGNVWEWTHTLYNKYPYNFADGREKEDDRSSRVLRGGSFISNHGNARCAFRVSDLPGRRSNDIGFRCGVFPITPL